MRLTPTELDRLTIFTAAELARRRRAKGWKLTYPEALALICDEMHEAARGGASYEDVVQVGQSTLTAGRGAGGRRGADRDDQDRMPVWRWHARAARRAPDWPGTRRCAMKPGEWLFGDGPIVLNAGRRTVELEVENTSDHTIFVSSHYPFFEVNRRLVFDRAQAWGMHLDIPAGDAVRWRPGEVQRVRLVAYGGRGIVRGFSHLTEGLRVLNGSPEGLERVRLGGYGHRPARHRRRRWPVS